ncbi:class II glutamine amidotransferase [Acidianus sulfidivorans JP7]|uniref:class II glutamine amidotransferase n=1 Tax=Acidianus sulfidivorans TaxID=312539 RepID=UPI001443486A|nr:class II glutamine amidotransferase [Acidianus sulfidivorans]QIJ32890.1 class II glutamine amidotransferase [Acidianus sulfidivorans JP7]
MCRIVAFNTNEGKINSEVIDALINSAKKDPFSIYLSHPDGWGFIVYVKKRNTWRSFYYRSPEPIYEDNEGIEILKSIKGNEIKGIIHVRKGNKKFLMGVSHNHPYYKRINQYDVYFAHNGSINRKAFVLTNPLLPYTDSYLFLEELSKIVTDSIENSYIQLFNKIKEYSTSMNSALLYYSEGEGPKLMVGYFYTKNNKETDEEYYRMYKWNNYIFSSTIKYYLGKYDNELIYDSIINL